MFRCLSAYHCLYSSVPIFLASHHYHPSTDYPNDPPKTIDEIIDQIDLIREPLGAIQHRLEKMEVLKVNDNNNGHHKLSVSEE
jgi:hypothetical protein